MSRRPPFTVLALVASFQLLACGGGSSSPPPPASTPHTSAPVAAATGGTVSLAGGAAVQIPANALAADTTITIQQSTDPAPIGAVGAAYDLGPSGTTFSRPVTVTLPVPAGTVGATVWTKPAGAAQYTSLPTSVSGGVATAQASHFSVFVLGAVDMTGTWTGPVTYAITNGNGTSGGFTTQMQSRDIVQDVGHVTLRIGNSTGFTASCDGTVQGDVLEASCTGHSADGACSTQYVQGGTVSATTWVNASTLTWPATCGGQTYTAQSSPLTRQTGAARNIAGTFARTTSYTMTGPGKTPVQGTGSGTVTRTQAAGSSLVVADVTMSGGATHHCNGIVVSDVLYSGCTGYSPDHTIRYNTTAQATITPGPPIDVDGVTTTTIVGDPSGYTLSTGQLHDVQQ